MKYELIRTCIHTYLNFVLISLDVGFNDMLIFVVLYALHCDRIYKDHPYIDTTFEVVIHKYIELVILWQVIGKHKILL